MPDQPTLPLHYARQGVPQIEGPAGLLGGLWYGPGQFDGWVNLDVGILSGVPCGDGWSTCDPVSEGQSGAVRWRQSGPWLFGTLQLDEAEHASLDLTALSQTAYGQVFSCLDQNPEWHLLRVWNYLPRINATDSAGGLERYRQFNTGRQQAFAQHGRDILAGSPAACAIGTATGPLRVYFLAGRCPALPVENPRQVPAYHYPPEFGPRSPTFSRACLVSLEENQCMLLISGTASIVGHHSLHRGDVHSQTLETLRNLQAVIDAAHLQCSAHFALSNLTCTAYVRHAKDAGTVMAAMQEALGASSPAMQSMVMLEADICRAELLVEIEAHACATGRLHSPAEHARGSNT